MVSRYSIATIIDSEYNSESIRSILDYGLAKGFRYCKYTLREIDYSNAPILSLDQAVQSILRGDTNRRVVVSFQNTFVSLNFINDGIYLNLIFLDFTHPWLKVFKDGYEDLDIGRYTRVLLDWIENYRILEMKVKKLKNNFFKNFRGFEN